MPYIGRAPTSTATKLEDADQDTKIQVEESSDEDTIRFDIAGAEDFTMTANTLTALSGSTIATNTIAETTGASGVTIDGLLIKDSTAAFADGAVATPSITNTGDLNTGVYFPAADTVGVVAGGVEQFRFGSNPIPGGSKNLIQNGAMTVNQRGSVAVAADLPFTVDRYQARLIGGGPARWTVTQDTTVPAGEGFGYSYKVDVTTIDASISTADYYGVTHTIEAQNLQHLNFNNAAASALTLTFWARTKKAGLHGGGIYNNDANRSLVFSWTAVADTWQKVTVAVPGDTSGVINNDTGAGLTIYWSFSGGKFMASDTGAWVAGAYLSVTSAVNDFDHVDNDFYITGVQLEVGSIATDFAHEDYGTTLNKCYRYYERLTPNTATSQSFFQAYHVTTTVASGIFNYTRKRVAPTLTFTAGATFEVRHQTTTSVCTAAALSGSSDEDRALCNFTVSSGLTAGQGSIIRRNGTDTTYIEVSAEL